jgi:hypothetical protein
VLRSDKEDKWGNRISSVWESVKKRFVREPPFREDLSTEVEK